MNGLGIFGVLSGALQLVVPSYALRLVRRFGTHRVGWFVVAAFASMGLVHLIAPMRPTGATPAPGLTVDLLYALASTLLIIGMGHLDSLFSERLHAGQEEHRLRVEYETEFHEKTAALTRANEDLVQEIVRRQQREKALEESVTHYRFLFAENPQPMCILDLNSFRFLVANEAALHLYGYSKEEFSSLSLGALLSPETVPAFEQEIAKPCPSAEFRGCWRQRRKDGRPLDVELTTLDFGFGDLPARLIVASNVGSRRQREIETREAVKTEAISRLAGGVAHHFNNILTVIDGHTDVLLHKSQDEATLEQLKQISTAARRAACLTRQLVAVGGKQLVQLESLDLNGFVQRLEPMLRRLVGKNIELEILCNRTIRPVMADRALLEHAIINLVLNARDALAMGGTLILSTTGVRVDGAYASRRRGARAGEFVRLTVRDTGCGMTPEVQARAFEPFFTTKELGKGTGLGLASVLGTARQHSGWVEFASKVGKGSEFSIYLPISKSPAATATTQPQAQAQVAVAAAKETVLLVEGDERTRGLAHFVLRRYGYKVIEADCAATALVLWEGLSKNIDLLLTDVHLTGDLSGRALAEQLRQNKPELKVLFTLTCGEGDDTPTDTAQLNGLDYIAKPYSPDKLLQAVHQGLATHG
jgi:PAS domain S-box-containing protein